MLQKLIALVLAFALVLTGIIEPAYADSSYSGIIFDNHKETNSTDYYNYGSSDYGNNRKDPSDQFIDSIVQGVVTTTGLAVGGVVTCYALDGIATAFFPPAAALAAFCPAIGGATGGAGVVTQLAR